MNHLLPLHVSLLLPSCSIPHVLSLLFFPSLLLLLLLPLLLLLLFLLLLLLSLLLLLLLQLRRKVSRLSAHEDTLNTFLFGEGGKPNKQPINTPTTQPIHTSR